MVKSIAASQSIAVWIAMAENEDIVLLEEYRSCFLPVNSHMNLMSFLDTTRMGRFLFIVLMMIEVL